MATFGIDTSGVATESLKAQAVPLIGGAPKFCGRYFNGTSSKKYQYDKSESAVLHQLGIPVLCFARQMWAVNDESKAQAHAKANMKGVVDAFGAQYLLDQNISPMLYLDLDPESEHPEHVMDQKYYEIWSATIVGGFAAAGGTIRFRPAVYLNLGDNPQSWLNLNTACAGGAVCEGVSVARYVHKANDPDPETAPPPPFDAMVWNQDFLTPRPNPIPPGHANANIPVIVWQYYGDYPKVRLPNKKIRTGDLDFEMVNPDHDAVVLSGLVPPPPPVVG
jgi:hypothetical protein